MKTFKTLVILRCPHLVLWATMRDYLPEFASRLPEIESVTQTDRKIGEGGQTHIVNEWRSSYHLPTSVRSIIGIAGFGWTDRNCWDERTHVCQWTIEPYAMAEHVLCQGQTKFEPAMAGQGTRVTLEGSLELKAGFLRKAIAAEAIVAPILESAVATVIPKSLRSTLEAAATFANQPSKTL